ncbi:MAG TPA: DUF899 family protein [Parafilimonas sp.]|nr:DUF899 family protein [Parafilimonas sp.]
MESYHDKRFPNETESYRYARNELLEAEINLRRQTEEVAAMRRKLPNGGKLKEDYVFEEMDGNGAIKKTKLSELFEPGKESLIIYSFMFGPQNQKPCVMCNSIIDGIDGMVFHAEQRVNIAVVAKTSIEKFKQWADSRGWKNVRLLSSAKNSYNKDYFGENEKLNQLPALNVFRKTPEGIFHFYATELLFAPEDEGQDGRHVDSIWPLWNLFDLIPEGRGTTWHPKHEYAKTK